MKTLFHTDDLIVPMLKFPDPCPVSIEIKEKDVVLHVGQRDWQWDLKDGHLVGQGTCRNPRDSEGMTKSDWRSLRVRRERVSQRMERDRKERLRKGTSPPNDDRISMREAEAIIKARKKKPKK